MWEERRPGRRRHMLWLQLGEIVGLDMERHPPSQLIHLPEGESTNDTQEEAFLSPIHTTTYILEARLEPRGEAEAFAAGGRKKCAASASDPGKHGRARIGSGRSGSRCNTRSAFPPQCAGRDPSLATA